MHLAIASITPRIGRRGVLQAQAALLFRHQPAQVVRRREDEVRALEIAAAVQAVQRFGVEREPGGRGLCHAGRSGLAPCSSSNFSSTFIGWIRPIVECGEDRLAGVRTIADATQHGR